MRPPRSLTLWPGGLVGRVILVLLGALGLEFAGSTLLYEWLIGTSTTVFDVALSTALFAGGVLLAAVMVVHTLGAPLRRLARVAGEIGYGPPVYVAEGRGPREVRQVARALNAMQTRISTMVRDRTEALAAVSHDLRTPIARLRLRVEALEGSDTVQAMQGDLAEMEQMIGAVLAFLNGQNDPEPRRTVDLVSIVQTLVDDAADEGAEVSYAGPDRCRIAARPLEIKRALSNLIDNALKYGGTARVSVVEGATLEGKPAVCVRIEDDGQGIPEAELERVFEPFHRVDRSRNAGLGGIGLGLAIVRQVVSRDGGRAVLRNRPRGGLCAEITLPIG